MCNTLDLAYIRFIVQRIDTNIEYKCHEYSQITFEVFIDILYYVTTQYKKN
jgi:hypothetical protein